MILFSKDEVYKDSIKIIKKQFFLKRKYNALNGLFYKIFTIYLS